MSKIVPRLVLRLVLLVAPPIVLSVGTMEAGAAAAEDDTSYFDLSVKELLALEVVTASKSPEAVERAPGIMTVIPRAEIEGYAARNLGELLNMAPSAILLSANVVTDNLICLRQQSLTPYNTHVLILLDGRPLRDPLAGGLNNAVLTTFPLECVEQVEIIRGPGSVLYGTNAFAGVINIISRRRDRDGDRGQVSITGGGWETFGQSGSILSRSGGFSALLGARRLVQAGPDYRFTDYEGVDSTVAWSRESTGLFARFEDGGFRASFFAGDFKPYALVGATNSFAPLHNTANGRQEALFGNLGWTRRGTGGEEASLDFTYNNHIWHSVSETDWHDYFNEASDYLYEASARLPVQGRGHLLLGGTLLHNVHESETLIGGHLNTAGFYSQLDYGLGGGVKAIAGCQYNKPEHIPGRLSPRAGVLGRLGDRLAYKLMYSQAFRAGSPLERAFDHPVFRGNRELRPETIETWEAQLSWLRRDTQVSLTGYWSRMADLITRRWFTVPEDPVYGGYLQHVNGEGHDFRGGELEWRGRFRRRWQLQGSLSWMRDRTSEGLADYSLHHRFMLKTGLLFTGNAVSVGIWNGHFASPTQVADFAPDIPQDAPLAGDFDLLTAKLSLNLSRLLRAEDRAAVYRLEMWAENLLDEDIRYPEYTTRGVNSLAPLRGGRVLYATFGAAF